MCATVVVVLSPEFVRKKCPMEELEIIISRKPGSFCLLPVWYGITYKQCSNLSASYSTEPWVGGEDKPAPSVLQHWAGNVKRLLDTVAVRDDQVRTYCKTLSLRTVTEFHAATMPT